MGSRSAICFMVALLCASCSIEWSHSCNYDCGYQDRLNSAADEITSTAAEREQVVLRQHKVSRDNGLGLFLSRHLDEVDRITAAYFKEAQSDLIRAFADTYAEHRRQILQKTSNRKLNPVVLAGFGVYALALPNGRIFVSDIFLNGFDQQSERFDPVVLGVLIHEAMHVRDGHSLEQWVTADGKTAIQGEGILGGLSSLISVIPGLTVDRRMYFPVSYDSAPVLAVLSEFSADIAAISLLNRSGYSGAAYIDFLRDAAQFASRTNAKGENVGLRARYQCAELLREEPISPRSTGYSASNNVSGADWLARNRVDRVVREKFVNCATQHVAGFSATKGYPAFNPYLFALY